MPLPFPKPTTTPTPNYPPLSPPSPYAPAPKPPTPVARNLSLLTSTATTAANRKNASQIGGTLRDAVVASNVNSTMSGIKTALVTKYNADTSKIDSEAVNGTNVTSPFEDY